MDTRSFSACHTRHTTTQDTTTRPQHHTETETDRDRERRERGQREKRKQQRRDKTKEDKTREEKTREKTHFQCGGAWPFFVGVVIFWLIPFASESTFFYYLRNNFSLQLQFSFFFKKIFGLCSYSFKFSELLVMQLQFLQELILHKYSVEGYMISRAPRFRQPLVRCSRLSRQVRALRIERPLNEWSWPWSWSQGLQSGNDELRV